MSRGMISMESEFNFTIDMPGQKKAKEEDKPAPKMAVVEKAEVKEEKIPHGSVPKKIAAAEKHDALNKQKISNMVSIVMFLVIIGFSYVNKFYGGIIAIVGTGVLAFLLRNAVQEMAYLEKKYGLEKKRILKKGPV